MKKLNKLSTSQENMDNGINATNSDHEDVRNKIYVYNNLLGISIL
jgi:hypothetical protein